MEGEVYTVILGIPVTFVSLRYTTCSFEHPLSATIEPD